MSLFKRKEKPESPGERRREERREAFGPVLIEDAVSGHGKETVEGVTGDVTGSDKVVVSSSGRVEGNIVAPRVQLEDGALFRGSIDMNPSEPAAAEKPAAAKAVASEKTESKAAPAAKSAAAGGGRQEPGLTLKSG